MVQEVRFPLGARQRVKNELKHLHPEYYCFSEAGKDPLSSDGDGMDTERPKSPWCHRGHFAVATFLHRGVFRSAQRRERHVEADKKTLRHMTRARVLRVDADLHDGERLQVFNVHQAWKTDGPPPANGKDATAHPHQPGARPDPPHPDPAHSRRSTLWNRIFWLFFVLLSCR